jgi:hypothetical protein
MYKKPDFKNYDLFLESLTLYKMIKLYCNSHHNSLTNKLCKECLGLFKYARKRLNLCPYYQNKIACNNFFMLRHLLSGIYYANCAIQTNNP